MMKHSTSGENHWLQYNVCALHCPDSKMSDIEYVACSSDKSSVLAICDGNGDHALSKVYSENLQALMLKPEGDLSKTIAEAFCKMDKIAKEKVKLKGSSMSETMAEAPCVSTCLLVQSNEKIIVVNNGDSRCIISRGDQIEVLAKEEQVSVTAGGIGDLCSIYSGASHVKQRTPRFESQITLSADIHFILLGSQGLWELLSNERAVSIVNKYMRHKADVSSAGDALLACCLEEVRARLLEEEKDEVEAMEADILLILIMVKKSSSRKHRRAVEKTEEMISIGPRFIRSEIEEVIRRKNLDKIFILCRTMDTERILKKLDEVTLSDDPMNPSYRLIPENVTLTQFSEDLAQIVVPRRGSYTVRSKKKATKLHVVFHTFKGLALNSGIMDIRTFKYLHPELFPETKDVSAIVRTASIMLETTRSSLRIFASNKGLVAGQIKLVIKHLDRQWECDCENGMSGLTIPLEVENIVDIRVKPNATKIRCILIVEKKTVFLSLNSAGIQHRLGCVLVTGSGQADEATRILIPKLAYKLGVPVYALVDCNPHGLEIVCTYKWGSKSHAHDNLGLTNSHIQIIGLHPKYVATMVPDKFHESLTHNDVVYLNGLLSRPYFQADEDLSGYAKAMLLNQVKCQLEAVRSVEGMQDYDGLLKFVAKLIIEMEDNDIAEQQRSIEMDEDSYQADLERLVKMEEMLPDLQGYSDDGQSESSDLPGYGEDWPQSVV